MYAREINGQEFSFGVSGKLIRNVLVMYDRQTDSYWSQLLGEAVAGEMIGTKLEYLPSQMTSWAQWKELYPETVALAKPFKGSRDGYERYYLSSDAGIIGETIQDDRLYTKEFVLGVEVNKTAVAYPFRILTDQPVINDLVDGTPVLLSFDPETANGVIFLRTISDQTLTFSLDEQSNQLVDQETGSHWERFTGKAVAGPLAGEQLTQLKSTRSFWFGWKDFHPETLIFGLDPE